MVQGSLEARLYGSPQWHVNGNPIKCFATRKVEALLIYLICTPRPVSRDSLAAIFWPDASQQNARNSLRHALSHLRTQVKEHMVIDRQEVMFNRASDFWLDTEAFSSGLASLFSPDLETKSVSEARPLDVEASDDALTDVLAIYTDDFLAGYHLDSAPAFMEWVTFQREHLRMESLDRLSHAADGCISQSEFEAGLAVTARLLAIEPLYESGHRQRMQLLAASGDPSIALRQYDECHRLLRQELGVEPSIETKMLLAQIQADHYVSRQPDIQSLAAPKDDVNMLQADLANLPRMPSFFGRDEELSLLRRWHLEDTAVIICLCGMGGVGKTALAAAYAHSLMGSAVERVLWVSLLNAPRLSTVLRIWLQALSHRHLTHLSEDVDELIVLLLDCMDNHHCLLVLDNLESIFDTGTSHGQLRPGYEEYASFFQQIAERTHQSTLLLTSREESAMLSRLTYSGQIVRTLSLSGLPVADGIRILVEAGLKTADKGLSALANHYSGNPLALKLVAEMVHGVYGGDAQAFLLRGAPVFGDIRQVLDQQFSRLSLIEHTLLTWLAVERDSVSVEVLWQDLAERPARAHFLDALRALQRRSLVESHAGDGGWRLGVQNVILEYVTERYLDACRHEIETGQFNLLYNHALVKAQSPEHVQDSQRRILLNPLAEWMERCWGSNTTKKRLKMNLQRWKADARSRTGYVAANILHLMQALDIVPDGWDFSTLAVWQADLRSVELNEVRFSASDLTGSRFREPLSAVLSVAYSRDGAWVAAATTDGEVILWDTRTHHRKVVCYASPYWLNAVAVSPDNTRVFAGSADSHIYLFDASSGTLLKRLDAHSQGVRAVAVSPDGEWMATGGLDQSICVWRLGDGALHRRLSGNGESVLSLAFHPDGRTMASGGDCVRIFEVSTGNELSECSGHVGSVTALAYSADGRYLASGGIDRTVRLWDAASSSFIARLDLSAIVRSLTFHPMKPMLLIGTEDGVLRSWHVQDNQLIPWHQAHAAIVWSLAFSPDGIRAVSGSNDHSVRIWDVKRREASQFFQGFNQQLWTIVSFQGGARLAAAGSDGCMRVVDLRTTQATHLYRLHRGRIRALAAHPGGSIIASGGADGIIQLLDLAKKRVSRTLRGHTQSVYGLSFHPKGHVLASCGDQTVRLWDCNSGQAIAMLDAHHGRASAVAFSADGKWLLSGGYDHKVHIWSMQGDRAITHHGTIDIAGGFVNGLALHAGRSIVAVTSTTSSAIELWQIPEGSSVGRLADGHQDTVDRVAFSPDGERLVSAGLDRSIVVWDLHDACVLQRLPYSDGAVRDLLWLDSGTIASCGSDGKIKLWNLNRNEGRTVYHVRLPYEGMDITGATGLSQAQRHSLLMLGAVDEGDDLL